MIDALYDPTTLLGQVRMYAADTAGPGLYTFSDTEIGVALGNASQDPMLAAALVLEMLAADQARLAMVLKNESTSTDMHLTADVLSARAKYLRENCGIGPTVVSPCQVFRPAYEGGPYGNMETW